MHYVGLLFVLWGVGRPYKNFSTLPNTCIYISIKKSLHQFQDGLVRGLMAWSVGGWNVLLLLYRYVPCARGGSPQQEFPNT